MDRKEIILNYIFTQSNKVNMRRINKLQYSHPNIYNYLQTIFDDSESLNETAWRLKCNILIRPTCKYCGGRVTWLGKTEYCEHCSPRCSSLDKNVQNKSKQTCQERYGTDLFFQSNIFKKKSKETCLEKYGVENFTQTDIQKKKQKKTKLERYGSETYNNHDKLKQTCLEKYGVDNPLKYKEIKDKIKQTCLEKYGVDNPTKTKELSEQISKKLKSKEIRERIYNTRKLNNTFNCSKTEDELYVILQNNFGNVIRQYRSKEYPFNCDFYIPSKDLYIEFQGSNYHGDKPYNSNDENDKIRLQHLIDRNTELKLEDNRKTTIYDSMIYVWTISDPLKRQTAKNNNLKYLEIWKNDNVNDIIKKIKKEF